MILPKRVFNSPLIEYANLEDRTFINLIRLNKPYKNGDSFAIYETTKCTFCSSKLFKTYEKAKENFELMIKNSTHNVALKERGIINN